jgi:hypothetical protein
VTRQRPTCHDKCGRDTLAVTGDVCACGCEVLDVTDEVIGGTICRGVRLVRMCEVHRVRKVPA